VLIFLLCLSKKQSMLSKQRIPDLIVIAILGLFLILLNYTGNIGVISNYPFIFLMLMYFVGRGVTWYIINKHMDNSDGEGDL
jgi:Sec-independent protein secretion pathway component TatC